MTSLPWSTRCVKYLLFIFNLLFVITGIIILVVGATIHGIYGNYSEFLGSGYMSTSAFLVAIGLIIFLISFFGCCGAIKENFCMTLTFSSLLIVIFVFELAAGISGYVLRDNTRDILEKSLNETMHRYKDNNENMKTFDLFQSSFNCCGVNTYEDWYGYFNETAVPMSCCDTFGAISNFTCDNSTKTFHNTPCVKAFGDFIAAHAVTIGGVALGLAFVQLIGIIFSCHLSKQIKSYQTV